ncbi:MAG: peptidylprolyl isomerase [Candidatus Marinimicrobia bacterium]|nr:peptidylprolyl isomerase [Candidatus Neomarinimicrobiota bacterium]
MTAEKSYDSDGVEHITGEQIREIIANLADFTEADATAEDVAVIETNAGTMIFRFYTDIAPIHANNFKRLANFGFYDGTTFHRVIPGFVIQGGDINSRDANRSNDGTGSPGYSIQAEFNPQPHVKGSLAMARSRNPNSAGSQFYIVLGRQPQLDDEYTVFGELIKGMEVMEAIAGATTDAADNPITPQRMLKVRVAPAATD